MRPNVQTRTRLAALLAGIALVCGAMAPTAAYAVEADPAENAQLLETQTEAPEPAGETPTEGGAENAADTADTSEPDTAEETTPAQELPGSPEEEDPGTDLDAETPTEPVTSEVRDAALEWGVKQSFRNYIYNFTAFEGFTTLLGDATQPEPKGVYNWSGGAGTVRSDGSQADIAFAQADGVHFQSHPMTVDGQRVYALDMTFTAPHIVLTSATAGELRMNVTGYEFESMTSVGEPYTLTDAPIATLVIDPSKVVQEERTVTWSGVQATMTSPDGEKAFGGFYPAGQQLDDLTFSATLADGSTIDTGIPTATELTVARAEATEGEAVAFTATVAPQIDGTVSFGYGSPAKSIGSVAVQNGTAVVTAKLPVGVHYVTAQFTPDDDDYALSVSESVQLTVKSPQVAPPAVITPGATTAEGSLRWGVSASFVNYTTAKSGPDCWTNSKHCAGGSITTSGVGAGWLFPQAAGSSWDANTHTGRINYSGSVVFNGYGQVMFQVVNPSITVTGPTTATLSTGNSTNYGAASIPLNLGAATKSVGAGGAVTWSNVPVDGCLIGLNESMKICYDSLEFTAGAVSTASYGSTAQGAGATAKKMYTAAAEPPATTGLTVLTDLDKIKPGGRIEIEAAGFEPGDEGILTVLYSDPTVLDDTATANANGVVTWSGTLPDDIAPGKHTITLQGSSNAGAVITVLDKDAKSPTALAKKLSTTTAEEAEVAGFLAVPAAGMPIWEWWAAAGGLLAIAACTTVLAVRQQRNLRQ